MAPVPNMSGEEREGRGGPVPLHLQGHHSSQAAHRGGDKR